MSAKISYKIATFRSDWCALLQYQYNKMYLSIRTRIFIDIETGQVEGGGEMNHNSPFEFQDDWLSNKSSDVTETKLYHSIILNAIP